MDHSWHPRPIQGNSNVCPTCSISHFPFCPPHPHPARYPGPTFEPIRGPMNMGRPVSHNHQNPYHDPEHWNRNPNLPPQVGDCGTVNCNDGSSRGVYSIQNHGYGDGGYLGNEYSNSHGSVSDGRSSKRLRVDGAFPWSYGGEVGGNVAKPLVEGGERWLGLVHDHVRVSSGFGYDRGVRGYVQERSGFDSRECGNSSNVGMRAPSSAENYGNVELGVDYRRQELEYRPAYETHYGTKRSASDFKHGLVGNEIQGHNHQVAPYGQVAKPPYPGSFNSGAVGHGSDGQSYGYGQPNYGNSFEPMPPNNAAMQYEQLNIMPAAKHCSNNHPPLPMSVVQPGHIGHRPCDFGGIRQRLEMRQPPVEGNPDVPVHSHSGPPHMDQPSGYRNSDSEHMGHPRGPLGYDFCPPLPSSPPPPLPKEPPPVHWSAEYGPSSSPSRAPSSFFPVRSSAPVHSAHAPIPETHAQANTHQRIQNGHFSRGPFQGDPQGMLTTFGQYPGGSQHLPQKNNLPDKPKTVDAAHLFKPQHRTSRPDHFVIILRGLPGSGKSYLAKMLLDLEIEHGGSVPRIHSMDDYFMTEVEKADENDASKSSVRGKKPKTKVVLEYCYEPEMEKAYRSSMLKAFRKTVEEGVFTFVIVDDRNLQVADFAQFWATAKRSGYEAYVLEAPYKDPAGCTARNVHGFSHNDVEKMAAQWEEAPSLYLQLDAKSLFHGDDMKKSSIQEVDMDTEDAELDAKSCNVDGKQTDKTFAVSPEEEKNRDEIGNSTEVKDLGRSKWSDNLDVDDHVRTEVLKGKANSLSTLLGTYGKEGKSVHWGDQRGCSGFSIGAVKKANMASLVIGPGAGYNLKSNPSAEEDATAKSGKTAKHNVFQERLRAERESFKAVFDRRRHRIGGLLLEDE